MNSIEENNITAQTDEDSTKEALDRYLRQTEEIRKLSVPQIRNIVGPDNYRETLLNNYMRIGELAKDNEEILSRHFFPYLGSADLLSKDRINIMRRFSYALNNAFDINHMDSPLAYQQSFRLLREADAIDDDDLRVIALDEIVSTAYVMICMTQRFLPVNDICMEYARTGLEASERLLGYLEKKRFSSLSEEAREMVIINARYIRVVSEIDGVPGNPENNAVLMGRMKAALELSNDPFYRELLPKYDWSMHEFRTLEYICSLTDYNNEKGFEGEDLIFINQCTKRLDELYESEDPAFRKAHNTNDIDVYLCRNAYLVGEISVEEYKNRLRELSLHDIRDDLVDDVSIIMLHAPFEYILLLDPENLTDEDKSLLNRMDQLLIKYMHQTPKMGRLTFLLSYMSLILKHYIEYPGGMDFETMGLNLIAALHPPTFVHTLCVADFTLCLTRQLLNRRPELFLDMPGIETVEDVKNKSFEIEDFAYHAALCHDFGKLTITETIITYGRNLLDEEFGFIKTHPSIGAYLLSLSPKAKKYADIAIGHHKWFDGSAGYPDDFDLDASPYKTIISIVTCADCLDAATDSVGRSYKKGKSLEELIEEFREGSGTRYAPYVVELFSIPEVLEEVRDILEKQRDENYIETYSVMKHYDE